jgi:hypothetical protein
MGRRTNQLGRPPQGQGHVDVCVEISYGEADLARRRLWDDLWSRLLCPIREMQEGQEEFASQSCRPQPQARGGRILRHRVSGVSNQESLNDTPHNLPTSSDMG